MGGRGLLGDLVGLDHGKPSPHVEDETDGQDDAQEEDKGQPGLHKGSDTDGRRTEGQGQVSRYMAQNPLPPQPCQGLSSQGPPGISFNLVSQGTEPGLMHTKGSKWTESRRHLVPHDQGLPGGIPRW